MATEIQDAPQTTHGRFSLVRDVSAEVEALYNHTKAMSRGTLITHVEIEGVTGLNYYSENGISRNQWYQKVVAKWRKLMLADPGIWPRPANGKGYYLSTVAEQQVLVPDAMEKSAYNKTRKLKKIIASIHPDEMTDTEKRFAAERIGQAAESLAVTHRHRVVRRSLLARPDTLPRPNGNMKK